MKEKKGISLIVNVITIIVMIIIAGAIIISINNSNVIDQAKDIHYFLDNKIMMNSRI